MATDNSNARYGSNSKEQMDVETEVLSQYAEELDCENCSSKFYKEFNVQVDGVLCCADKIYLVEVWAHIGEAKPAQKSKISRDMLKLIFIESQLIKEDRKHGKPRTIIKQLLFVDDDAKNTAIAKKSWVCAAAKEYCFDLITRDISADARKKLLAAQDRQAKSNK